MSGSVTDFFPAILFGWPTIITALLLCIAGVWLKRTWIVVTGALLSLPFSYYLTGSPIFGVLGIVIPICLFASAYAVRRQKMRLAWLLLLPFVGIALYIGTSVLWSR